MATAAPSLANAIAVALPIPELPPATIAPCRQNASYGFPDRHYYLRKFQNGMRLIHANQKRADSPHPIC
jgi:hypothetical protein